MSQIEEQVVEVNTTLIPQVVEDLKIESTMAEEEVTSLPIQEIDCLNLDEDMVLLEELVSLVPTIRKVGLRDFGQVIFKWIHNN